MNSLVRLPLRPVSLHSNQKPLGTAAWLPDGQLPQYRDGYFWLGRSSGGGEVGLRDDRHVLVCAGTRGGKGTSFIVPNLCTWKGSAIVVDPKGENAIVTARRRGSGSIYAHGMSQKVCILDPFGIVRTSEDNFADLKTSFNPLDVLRPDNPEAVETAYQIADGMIAEERTTDPFWNDAAKDLIAVLLLHVASSKEYARHQRNLLTVRRLLVEGDMDSADLAAHFLCDGPPPSARAHLYAAMIRNKAFGGVIARAGAGYAETEKASPRVSASILQVAKTNTQFIDGPGMAKVLSSSSFRLDELKTAAGGVTVYLCLPQRMMESHYRWLRMMLVLSMTTMERVPRRPAAGHQVLMVMDEFPALRRMRVVENAAAQIAGYGVKMMFVVQTLAQLKDVYKDNWETFLANAGVKIFTSNDDHFTRDYVSKLIGDEEVVRTSGSYSRTAGKSSSITRGYSVTQTRGSSTGSGNSWNSSTSVSATLSYSRTSGTSESETQGYTTSVHKRQLVSPDEVGRLFGRDSSRALVLLSGSQAAVIKRVSYFSDWKFRWSYGWHPDHQKPPPIEEAVYFPPAPKPKFCLEFYLWSMKAQIEGATHDAQKKAEREAEEARREKARRFKTLLDYSANAAVALSVTSFSIVLALKAFG